MKIKLNEIPENGRDYKINRKSAELNEDLKDLINDIINNWFREEYLIINESIIDLFD